MTIYGIGTDILRANRIRLLMERRGPLRVAKRFLTEQEFVAFQRLKHPFPPRMQSWEEDTRYMWLAVRFSVKEAVFKAAFPRLKLTWKDVDLKKKWGKPYVRILDPLKKHLIGNIHVSITHDGDYVSTFCVIERPKWTEDGEETEWDDQLAIRGKHLSPEQKPVSFRDAVWGDEKDDARGGGSGQPV
ncbi:4'-phosphopantetheinyl transferase [Dacryopinax primogenitus]|uniref:4'-phosphopantetheinyl transferase n=1 Tax=Dacryopinax primogenitus (strain DJM 731) TaxID=1858805 RepID=M5FQ87_DACPD|nr:4'-phosphopantetheinyl transferase [Dacryopinax primogenitus]EJT97578.1 4'-phosphopantetheinyl transferase [Dacryopinax primogenitus]